ncbi:amino acid decarboxylase [Leisingera sp. HS039]|uniref:pyridoxal phosphate-dependent decarboxylase family protein n=1 Tax=unclassified Leisingera TaxID=2614906 RepID=UPI00107136C2|nr:pyridoxal-dependent decarboxylase [Leisingera sp. NJS201]MBQ4826473.1 amino acid decarboxylase [Leisingera sp. HS039]QBR36792.1 amino acid decarboxylase [Leisingera sp. NJS201]
MADKGIKTQDWAAFRAEAQRMLGAALDQMQEAAERPWQPVPEDIDARYAVTAQAQGPQAAVDRIIRDVLPYHGGNTHPRFWGWVQGSGLASDLIASVAAAAVNANMGGRDHGANYMERAVVDWTRRKMGMPDGASGLLVTGTSQATVIAFQAARLRVMKDLRQRGQGDVRLTAYAGEGVHNATLKAVELLGIGSDNLRKVPLAGGQIDCAALAAMVAEDKAAGALPFLVVGTAGSVDLGLYDDLNALADAASGLGLWLHVDGAFGAWTRIAAEPWRSLSDGIGRADSIALDFHKWMYVGYDCGMALLRNEDEHRAAFSARPSYLEGAERGLAGGEPWFCDYGIDLSRGNRALKVWTALETYGEAAFCEAITGNCELAAYMAAQVEAQPDMALGAPVVSNVCVFTARSDLPPEAQSEVNARVAQTLQESGEAVFSTTRSQGRVMLRAAITNHRSREADVRAAIAAVAREAAG